MLAGLICNWDRLQVRLEGSASLSHTGHGSASVDSWSCEMSSAYVYNIVLLNPGIYLKVDSSQSLAQARFTVEIPGLGISKVYTSAGYSNSLAGRIDLVGFRCYVTYLGQMHLEVDSVEVYVGGVLEDTLPGGTIGASGIGPCYVPLLGLPFEIAQPSISYAVTGVDVNDNYSYDTTGTVTATGGWRFRELSGDPWTALPISLPTISVPACFTGCNWCHTPSGVVSATDCWTVTVQTSDRHKEVQQAYDWEFYVYQDVDSHGGRAFILPDLDKTAVRLGESGDFAALFQRGGFPKVTSYGSRTCSPVPAFGSPPSTVRTETQQPEVYARQTAMLSTVLNASHTIDDPLGETTYAPMEAAKSSGRGQWVALKPAPFAGTAGPPPMRTPYTEGVSFRFPCQTDTTTDNGDMLDYLDWDDGDDSDMSVGQVVRYVSYWANPHWSYWYHPRDWALDGAAAPWELYWSPVRSQHLTHPDLPSGEDRLSRNSIVSAPLNSNGLSGFLQTYVTGELYTSWRGVCRFKTDVPDIPASIALDSASSPAWSSADATFTFGSNVSVDPSATTVTIDLDIARWDAPPYQYPLGCGSVNLQWGATNIVSVKVYLVGVEGSSVLITDNVEGTFPVPSGSTTKYAGTWAKDYGVGYATDQGTDATASGASLATLADPERAGGFELLPGRSGSKLRFVVEVADHTLPFTLEYPVWHRPGGDFALVPLTGQSSSLIYENGPHQQWGEWSFFDFVADAFIDNPSAPNVWPIGAAPTIGDYLCWRREALEGTDRENGLDAEIAALYLNGTEYTLRDHMWRDPGLELVTHAWIMALGSPKKIVGCLVNSFSEIPPLAMLPHQNRNQYLEADSTYCQKVWDYAFEGRRLIVEGITPAHLTTSGGTQWTSVAAAPAGWSVSSHVHAVDGTETGFKVVYGGAHYGTVRPYHGFFSILWPASARSVSLAAAPNGILLAVWVDSVGIQRWRLNRRGLDERDRMLELADVATAQAAYLPKGGFSVFYALSSGGCYRMDTRTWGLDWSTPEMIVSGRKQPAPAIDPRTGSEFVATWAEESSVGTWRVHRKLADGESWTDMGPVATGPEISAGLRFSPDGDRPLVFVLFDGAEVTRYESLDYAQTWQEVI
jgi:hypothetical protein